MKKFKFALVVILMLSFTGSLFASNEVYPWDRFILGLDPVKVSISRNGDTLTPKNVLNINKEGIKDSALAMAIGYCVFLKLTELPAELHNAGADEDMVNRLMMGTSINQWLATAWQETAFSQAVHSGYYQIDNAATQIASNASWMGPSGSKYAHYYSFLAKLNGGALVSPKNWQGPPPQPDTRHETKGILCDFTQQGFVWASVEKGYYEAISYLQNFKAQDHPSCYSPYEGYTFAGWAVDYAKKTDYKTHYPLPADEHKGKEISPCYGFEQILSWMYNRGQFPFVTKDLPDDDVSKGKQLVRDVIVKDATTPIEKVFTYRTTVSDDDSLGWGCQYVWQLPWVCSLLNESKQIYSETINEQDVIDVLELLKGFYNGEIPKGDKAVEAAIAEAKKLEWGKEFDSEATFNNLNKVVNVMMETSTHQ